MWVILTPFTVTIHKWIPIQIPTWAPELNLKMEKTKEVKDPMADPFTDSYGEENKVGWSDTSRSSLICRSRWFVTHNHLVEVVLQSRLENGEGD